MHLDLLFCFVWCSCMAIGVSLQYNGGFLHDVILSVADPMSLPSGNLFKCHKEVWSLQPMIPPERFDIFPLTGGCSGGPDAFRFCFKQTDGKFEATLRRRRILFAVFVARMEDARLPKCVMFGE